MANRKDHAELGVWSAVLATLATSRATNRADLLRELVAAGIGGWLGSGIPDVLEPATHPGHRSFFHSIGFNGVAAHRGMKPLLEWRARSGDASPNPVPGASRDDATASAFVLALAIGHLSHLLLDALTPRGLPLLK